MPQDRANYDQESYYAGFVEGKRRAEEEYKERTFERESLIKLEQGRMEEEVRRIRDEEHLQMTDDDIRFMAGIYAEFDYIDTVSFAWQRRDFWLSGAFRVYMLCKFPPQEE